MMRDKVDSFIAKSAAWFGLADKTRLRVLKGHMGDHFTLRSYVETAMQ